RFAVQDHTPLRRAEPAVSSGSLQCAEPHEFRDSLADHADQYRRRRRRGGSDHQYGDDVPADSVRDQTDLLAVAMKRDAMRTDRPVTRHGKQWAVLFASLISLAVIGSDLRLVEAVRKQDREAVRSLLKQHVEV